MKNWKLFYKVAFIDISVVFLIGLICAIASDSGDGFGIVLGIILLIGGVLNILATVIAFIASSGEFAKGFAISCGILLLLSGISCGTGLSGI